LYEENIRYSSENLKHYQKSFKEALKINDFNQTYGKLNELKKKSLSSKTALEEQYNFNIDESKDVNILEVN
jgi:phenylacetate-coenzyme A ligase PaaK-like adenylate-forming protein